LTSWDASPRPPWPEKGALNQGAQPPFPRDGRRCYGKPMRPFSPSTTLPPAVARARAAASAATSYTRKLLGPGRGRTARKKARRGRRSRTRARRGVRRSRGGWSPRAADLLYHLLVVLEARGVTPRRGRSASRPRRTAQSGLQEKASRDKSVIREVANLLPQDHAKVEQAPSRKS